MDADFKPDSPTCFFSLPAPAPPERVRGVTWMPILSMNFQKNSTFFPFH